MFHPGPFPRKARAQWSAAGENVFAFHGGPCSDGVHTEGENGISSYKGVLSGKIFDFAKPANVSLWKELSGYFARPEVKAKLAARLDKVSEPERRTFLMANMVAEQLAFRFFNKFVQQLSSGNMVESVQALSAIAPILVILTPYIYGFHSQAPSRKWLRKLFKELTGEIPVALQNHKRAWFTDTLEDVNGVATTIRKMTAAGAAAGKELVVVASRSDLQLSDIPIKNFPPIGEFELPEYELQKLSFPPILQMLDYVQRERFTEIIISTPGPVGLTALLAAKMLNLQTSGIYHTDFPQYIRILTEDSFLESVAWGYMHWFYGQLDTVFVNSEEYKQSWIKRGFDPSKLKILPRGLDTELFHPGRRDSAFFEKFGASNGELRLLYVGRISREKDLDLLADAYRRLRKEATACSTFCRRSWPIFRNTREIFARRVFYRLSQRHRIGDRICFGRYLCFSQHHRHLRQRSPRSTGFRIARCRFRFRRPEGISGAQGKRSDYEVA